MKKLKDAGCKFREKLWQASAGIKYFFRIPPEIPSSCFSILNDSDTINGKKLSQVPLVAEGQHSSAYFIDSGGALLRAFDGTPANPAAHQAAYQISDSTNSIADWIC